MKTSPYDPYFLSDENFDGFVKSIISSYSPALQPSPVKGEVIQGDYTKAYYGTPHLSKYITQAGKYIYKIDTKISKPAFRRKGAV